MAITNAMLAQQVVDLLEATRVRDEDFAAWLVGTASGGPTGDGRYVLRDYLGTERRVKAPARLQEDVDSLTSGAQGYRDAAQAARDAAQNAQAAAESARDTSITQAANAAQEAADAADSRDAAANYQAGALTYRESAKAWASTVRDTVVADGLYSARHYAEVAGEQEGLAEGHATDAAASASAAATSESNAAQSASDAADSAAAAATFDPALFRAVADPVPWADLSGLPAFATRWPTWAEVAGKPSLLATDESGAITGAWQFQGPVTLVAPGTGAPWLDSRHGGTTGSAARGLQFTQSDGTRVGGVGALWSGQTLLSAWLGTGSSPWSQGLQIAGDGDASFTGDVNIGQQNLRDDGQGLMLTTPHGFLKIGPANSSWSHFRTDRPSFWFEKTLTVQGRVDPYTDRGHNLGQGSLRWADIYASGLDVEAGANPGIDGYRQGRIWTGYVTAAGADAGDMPSTYSYIVNFGSGGGGRGLQLASYFGGSTGFYARRASDNAASPNGANSWQPWERLVTSEGGVTITGAMTFTGGVVLDSNLRIDNGNVLYTDKIGAESGQQLVVAAGEALGQMGTGNIGTGEVLWLASDGSVSAVTSSDNWQSGWVGRHQVTLLDQNGDTYLKNLDVLSEITVGILRPGAISASLGTGENAQLSWEDGYYRLRLGGGQTPEGFRIDAFDTPRFTFEENGDLRFTGILREGSVPYGRLTSMHEAHNATSSGWVTIAEGSARCHGEFIIADGDSGNHGFARFMVTISYGNAHITVLSAQKYGSVPTVDRIRVVRTGDIYSTIKLQIQKTGSETVRCEQVRHPNPTFAEWTSIAPVAEDPSGTVVAEVADPFDYALSTSDSISIGKPSFFRGDSTARVTIGTNQSENYALELEARYDYANPWNLRGHGGFRHMWAEQGNTVLRLAAGTRVHVDDRLDVNGALHVLGNYWYGSGGNEAIRTSDSWLRLNNNRDFSSGVYTPGAVRADDGFAISGNSMVLTTGNYGTFSIVGEHVGGYCGLSLAHRLNFMENGSGTGGLYWDSVNEWALRTDSNGAVQLYHNGSSKLATASDGVNITGNLTLTGTLDGGTVPWARISGAPTQSKSGQIVGAASDSYYSTSSTGWATAEYVGVSVVSGRKYLVEFSGGLRRHDNDASGSFRARSYCTGAFGTVYFDWDTTGTDAYHTFFLSSNDVQSYVTRRVLTANSTGTVNLYLQVSAHTGGAVGITSPCITVTEIDD